MVTDENDKVAWMTVANTPGVGPRTLLRIWRDNRNGARSMADFLSNVRHQTDVPTFLNTRQTTNLADSAKTTDRWRDELARLQAQGIDILTLDDPRYPQSIVEVMGDHVRGLLYYQGDPSILRDTGIAIVGSRKASPSALKIAEMAAKKVVDSNIVVVSGYAAGVDTAAHFGAMKAGGRTTIVLPFGFGHFRWKRSLQGAMDKGKALVITAYSPATKWSASAAMERNQIITALSGAVLIVAARKTGGTINEAEGATQQGRRVFVVEYGQYDEGNEGNKMLIERGAVPVRGSRQTGEPRLKPLIDEALNPSSLPLGQLSLSEQSRGGG